MRNLRALVLTVSLAVVMLFVGMFAVARGDREELFRALGNLAEVIHLVETEYVDELNQEALALSLDAGIAESVDRWAAVLAPDQVEQYRQLMASPPPYGLGLASRLSTAAVRNTVAGSPAAAAGLEPWEVIELVEGVNTRGRPLWQIRLELAGREAAGQPSTLTVLDREVDERRDVVLEAAPWSPGVGSIADRDGVRVVTVESLGAGAAEQIARMAAGDEPLVLDLRDLVWGTEEEAVATVDLFVADGTLAQWQGRRAGSELYPASPDVVAEVPPVVVVGHDTEWVGEILAAGLQSAGSVLVGVRTIGHAPMMRLVTDGDIHLWMPVGAWLRADGEPIDGNGVEPDDEVAPGPSEEADPVLERAVQLALERSTEVALADAA